MNKATELYREAKKAYKAWDKTYDLPIAKSDIKRKKNEYTYKEFRKIEKTASDKLDSATDALYNHLTKNGIKIARNDLERLIEHSSGTSVASPKQHEAAKAKMRLMLKKVGEFEKKRLRAKYKLPSMSQLIRGCGRR